MAISSETALPPRAVKVMVIRSPKLLLRRRGFCSSRCLRLCPLRWKRIVPVLGVDLKSGPLHAHFDVAEGAGGLLGCVLAQGVLITSFHRDPLISTLDRLLRELVQNVTTGCVGVSRKNIAVAEAGNPRLFDLAVKRHGCSSHADG